MGLEELKNEIINEAEVKKDKILKEAEDEIKTIEQTTRKSIKELKDRNLSTVERQKSEYEKVMTASAQFQAKKLELDMISDVLDKTIQGAKDELPNISDEKRREIIQNLLAKSRDQIQVSRVYANPKDQRYIQDVTTIEADMIGGIIAENESQDVRVDFSFETIMQEVIKDNLNSIITKLKNV